MPLKQKVKGFHAKETNMTGASENTETSHSNYLVAILSISSFNEESSLVHHFIPIEIFTVVIFEMICNISRVSCTVCPVTAKYDCRYFKLNWILTERCVFRCAVIAVHTQPRHVKIGFMVPSSNLFLFHFCHALHVQTVNIKLRSGEVKWPEISIIGRVGNKF